MPFSNSRIASRATLIAVVLVVGGCAHTPPTSSHTNNITARYPIATFSESAEFVGVVPLGRHIYAATTTSLLQFERESATYKVSKEVIRTGESIIALAGHPATGLWIATSSELKNQPTQQTDQQTWRAIPYPKGFVATRIHITLATANQVWLGTSAGLARYANGEWKSFLPGAAITAITAASDGNGVWVGTQQEGLYFFSEAGVVHHDVQQGQPVQWVRGATTALEGGIFVFGTNTLQQETVAFYDGRYWTTYEITPAQRINWLAYVGSTLHASIGTQVIQLNRLDPTGKDPRATTTGPSGAAISIRGYIAPQAKAPSRYPISAYQVAHSIQKAPVSVKHTIKDGYATLFVTANAGILSIDSKQSKWYRSNDLSRGTDKLKLACNDTTCYLASGDGKLYQYQQGRFLPFLTLPLGASYVYAAINDHVGGVVVVHGAKSAARVTISRLAGGALTPMVQAKLIDERKSEKQRYLIRFARYDRIGQLWLGLQYLDQEGQLWPWGVSVVRADGSSIFHRSSLSPTEDRPAGSLALPDDIRDTYFAEQEIWVATDSGICRVRNQQVELFGENDGLKSEFIYAIKQANNGDVWVGSNQGLVKFDGKRWHYDQSAEVQTAIRALLFDRDQIWIGTDRGLVVRGPGQTTDVLTEQHGLAASDILDLQIVHDRALWVLTSGGISILQLR